MRRLAALAVVVVMAVTGCGDGETHVVSIGDAGTTVSLALGDTLQVTLSTNPSTGYAWEVVGDPQCVVQRGDPRYTSLDELMGSNAVVTFEMEAVQTGAEELTMVYRRPWEDLAPERTFAVQVVVEG